MEVVNERLSKNKQFQDLIYKIFRVVGYNVESLGEACDTGVDIIAKYADKIFLGKIMYSSLKHGMDTLKLKAIIQRLKENVNDNEIPLFITSSSLGESKKKMLKEFGVEIVDINDLLYLVQDDDVLYYELLDLVEFSVSDITMVEPHIPYQLVSNRLPKTKRNYWTRRFKEIKPGIADFSKYEELCIEIIKYLFLDSLGNWREQVNSNDNLYRFDLICKVKKDTKEDFFDMLKNYFNTKYIVFDFKNYSEKITQKEIYTTEKYLYNKALRSVAIIVSRFGMDNHAFQAIKGILREQGKLIISITDEDLLNMVDLKEADETQAEYLSAILDDMLMELEK